MRAARERGDAALLLIPADDALRAFYERLGYRGDLPVRFKETPGAFDFGTGDPLRDRAMILPLKPWPQLPEALECRYAGAPADACPDAMNAFAHSDTAVAGELADECPEKTPAAIHC